MDVFFEIHKDLPREGPGCNESTKKAFELLPEVKDKPVILDIGCGPGMQTRELARLSSGHITALDNHLPFLNQLKADVKKAQYENIITVIRSSMFDSCFKKESFDIIWSEGALYIMDFKTGLKYWKRFLKPGGCMAVTELSWFEDNPPRELFEFWMNAYPTINNIQKNMEVIENSGYTNIAHFTLPEKAWWDDYYKPVEKRIQMLVEKYKNNPEALAVLNEESAEISLYRNYSKWYGYVFYIMQK